MPFEERDEIQDVADSYGIYNINLFAPTSADRVTMIANESKGFLYVVSSLGVTGTRSEITTDFETLLAPLKGNSPVPYCIGFGISNPAQAAEMAKHSDGVIVGSAIVNRIAENGRDSAETVGKFVGELKAPLK
jgi:tryptophan synthase alpha chain